MEDRDIVKLYMDRSEKAISETSKKYGRYCHYIAYNILQNNEDSEECVNDTYLRTWSAIPPNNPKRLQTFLGKITRNLSLNKLEMLSAKKRNNGQIDFVLEELTECIPEKNDVENALDEMLIKNILNDFLGTLPAETRKIFVRRYWYMSSVKEIAREYHISESKVTVTLFRTREKLKTLLEKEGITL